MSLKASALNSAIWTFCRFSGRQGANTLAFFILAILLSPSEFGLGSIAIAFPMIFQIIVRRGFRDRIIQIREDEVEGVFSTLFFLNVSIGLTLTLVTIAMAFTIGQIFSQSEMYLLLAVSAFIPLFSSVSAVLEGWLEREFDHKFITFSQIISSSLACIVAITIAFHGGGAWAVVAFSCIEVFSFMVINLIFGRKFPTSSVNTAIIRKEFSFVWPIILGAISTGSINRVSQLIIGLFLGAAAVGQYRVGLQIASLLIQIFRAPLVQLLLPVFSRYEGEINIGYTKSLSIFSVIFFPVFFGAAAVSQELLVIILGEEWNLAASISAILCIAVIPSVFLPSLEPALLSTGRVRQSLYMSLCYGGLSLVFVFIAVNINIYAVAYSTVLASIFTIPVAIMIARKHLLVRVSAMLYSVFPFFVISLIMFVCVRLYMHVYDGNTVASLILVIFTSILFYLLSVRFVVSKLCPSIYSTLVDIMPHFMRRFT